MIIVEFSKSGRLKIRSHNTEPFNHVYGNKTDGKRAWNNFVKQIKADRVQFRNFPKPRKKKSARK